MSEKYFRDIKSKTKLHHTSPVKISVAMCTYNGEKFLETQLQSIDNQLRKPDEIIICDDRSEDRTVQIINEFSARTNIPVLLKRNALNLGYAKNFEQAISKCSGEFIFLSDQDDIWHTNKTIEIIKIFEENMNLLVVAHDGKLIDAHGVWHGTTKMSQIVKGYGKKALSITGALCCVRKKALDLLLPFPAAAKSHDGWLSYVFSYFPEHLAFYDQCLQDIRRHSSNTSEWVVNSFHPITRLDAIRSQMSSKVASDYSDRVAMNRVLQERVNRLNDSCTKNYFRLHHEHNVRLIEELKAIEARQKIADHRSRYLRWVDAVILLVSGGYKFFNGYKSFLRDIAR